MYELLVFGILCLSTVAIVVLSSILVAVLQKKYPDIYNEYGKPNPIILSLVTFNFIAEFIIGGVYKSELNEEDQKYASRVTKAVLFSICVWILYIYMVFSN